MYKKHLNLERKNIAIKKLFELLAFDFNNFRSRKPLQLSLRFVNN